MKIETLKKIISFALLLTFAAALAGAPQAGAGEINLRVAFEDVRGAAELDAGDIELGIEITRSELEREDVPYAGRLLANLCGAYIVNRAMSAARRACERAVAVGNSPAAYNNRGVFRALTGDLDGARRDFARVRPKNLDAFLEELLRMDPRYMARQNLAMLEVVAERTSGNVDSRRLPLEIPAESLQ